MASHHIEQYLRRRRFWCLLPLVLAYLVELIFTLFEFDEEIYRPRYWFYKGHTFASGKHWDGWDTDVNFAYGFMEIGARCLIFVSAHMAIKHGLVLRIFYVCATLEMIDVFDYWAFFNDKWFNTGLEFNYVKIVVILVYAWKEYSRKLKHSPKLA
jgi:hypothetical protein